MRDDDTPDNMTIASTSYMAEDDRFDLGQSTGHRKRKREDEMLDQADQQHTLYANELLDYFLLSRAEKVPAYRPEPPPNFQPNWVIDGEKHTALHWASAMGDVDVIKQLRRFGASQSAQNFRGETPLMRAVHFTNCYEKQTFPQVMRELFETVGARDLSGCTIIHHAAVMKGGRATSQSCSRYFLDNILNKLQETHDSAFVQQMLDAQDNDGNTALHLAAQINYRKCIRALLGRNASTDIPNHEGVRAEDLILELNASKKERGPQRSSSPFAPESQRHASFRDVMADKGPKKMSTTYQSDAANAVKSRIMPLMAENFQNLARSYEDEWQEMNEAESEARRILLNTQADLAATQHQIADLKRQLEADESASKVMGEANLAQHQVLSLIMHQNRLHVQSAVDQELAMVNGDSSGDSYDDRLALARELGQILEEQRQAESEYVEALSTVGTGDKIEKYRRLLKMCLDGKDAESLDDHLDSLVEMMEEERDVGGMGVPAGDALEGVVGM